MEISELTIPIEVKLGIDLSTAEGCLKLVEIYINNHKDVYIEVKKNSDGTHRFRFVNIDGKGNEE